MRVEGRGAAVRGREGLERARGHARVRQRAAAVAQRVAVRERAAVLVALTDGMLLEWYRFSGALDGRALAESAKAQILSGLGVTAQ